MVEGGVEQVGRGVAFLHQLADGLAEERGFSHLAGTGEQQGAFRLGVVDPGPELA